MASSLQIPSFWYLSETLFVRDPVVTSETSQIQTLIHQIDEVLSRTSPRLPWVMSSDAAQQRQVLEQTRRYLLSLQQREGSGGSGGSGSEQKTETAISNPKLTPTVEGGTASAEASAQQVLQAVLQEMTYLRTNMLQPMQSDVAVLQHQRDALLQEVRRLEMQRQQYLMTPPPEYLKDFLQSAMVQIQENLSGQVAQMMAAVTVQTAHTQQLQSSEAIGALGSADLSTLSPAERLKRLQSLQAQSDQLLLKLDTTLRVVFESLQRNLQSYQDSLGEGLGRMHDMGQQGEAVFAAFVTRLAQILGREASSFLQTPSQAGHWEEEQRLAYGDPARTLPGQDNQTAARNDPDSQITRLLEELNALDQSGLNQTASGEPVPFELDDSSSLSPEAERDRLAELDRELSQLDLSEFAAEFSDAPSSIEPGVDVTRISTEEQPFPFPSRLDEGEQNQWFEGEANDSSQPGFPATESQSDDLDSALDLLSQLPTPPSDAEDDAPLKDATSGTAKALPSKPPLVSSPDNLYEDAFYQDLFGQSETEQPEESQTEGRDASEIEPFALPVENSPGQNFLETPVANTDPAANIDPDLFAGLADPSQEAASAPNEPSPFEQFSVNRDLPQSVEQFLLQQPEPPTADPLTLDNFLDEEIPDPLGGIDLEPSEANAETITSLTDLLPDDVAEMGRADTPNNAISGMACPQEEYETAHPEEDLLITEPPPPDAALDLRLPENTLQQLTNDLSNLEGGNPPGEVTQGWTLADWTEAVERSQPPNPPEASEPQETSEPQIFQTSDWTVDADPDAASASQASPLSIEEWLFSDRFANNIPTDPSFADPFEGEQTANPDSPGSNDVMESTLEDWFADVEADPAVTPEAAKNDVQREHSALGGREVAPSNENDSTFTLDGLESLFEGTAPPPPRKPSETDTQRITIDDAFSDFSNSSNSPPPEDDEPHSSFPPSHAEVEKKKFNPRDNTH